MYNGVFMIGMEVAHVDDPHLLTPLTHWPRARRAERLTEDGSNFISARVFERLETIIITGLG